MPLQNRVTPFWDLVAISQRGLFTGNRGIIHDPTSKTLLAKRWATKSWLVCSCQYQGRRRTVMSGRSWTELFFLDEATAMAAGHRPCFLCRRDAAITFQALWRMAFGAENSAATKMDGILHGERLTGRAKRLHPLESSALDLPDGAMVAIDGAPVVIADRRPFLWTPTGYQYVPDVAAVEGLVTPPSTLTVMRMGYRPVLHPSLHALLK